MNSRTKALAIGGGVAAAALIGWIVLSNIATSRAEDALYEVLDEYNIRQNVHWRDLSASPFGKVEITDLSINVMGKTVATIDNVEIDDFTNTANKKSIRLQAKNIANAEGLSPLADTEYLLASGMSEAPPFSLNAKWDFDLRDDEGKVEIAFKQPNALEGKVSLELENIKVVSNMRQNLMNAFSSGSMFGSSSLFGTPIWMLGAQSALEALGSVGVRKAEASVKDDGYVERAIALHKRYEIPVTLDEKNPDKARDKIYEKTIDDQVDACKKAADTRFRNIPKAESSCKAIGKFLHGKSSSLTLKSQPNRPVTLSTFFETASNSPDQALLLMAPVLD